MERNPEGIVSRSLRYYYNHRAECLGRQAEYREKMTEGEREAMKMYRKRYYQANKARINAARRAWRRLRRMELTGQVDKMLTSVPKPSWYAEAMRLEEAG